MFGTPPSIEERMEQVFPVEGKALAEEKAASVEVSSEAAAELRAALARDDEAAKAPAKPAAEEAKTDKPEADKPKPNYDAAIKQAMDAGDPIKAAILKSCQSAPSGGTLKLHPNTAALMRQYCKDRDFEIVVDRSKIRPSTFAAAPSSNEESQKAQPDAKIEACRKEARKHIISCAKVTDYQNCETWGCPEIIECDKRLTRCDDHGSPYNQSGEFYCDNRNWRTRDFDYEKVLERACPTE
ncbi:hypothetical protein [Henriciella sp.]|uniref:hypothetical protein n=1 Tax=Henriciella sp. TaxID=1968823 RepID=UPI002622272C|nr:hypothetical protein [Henriciella sp.]